MRHSVLPLVVLTALTLQAAPQETKPATGQSGRTAEGDPLGSPGHEEHAKPAAKVASTPARRAFDRLKALEGTWRGKSTKGWTDHATIQVIAGGSAVVSTSDFDAHKGQTMVTVFHLDGEKLMLTHYCVAKNQPRLVATTISEDGANIGFTFLDGANIPTRDTGHMDRAEYRFESSSAFTTRWSWYEKGGEKWFEEIKMERVPG